MLFLKKNLNMETLFGRIRIKLYPDQVKKTPKTTKGLNTEEFHPVTLCPLTCWHWNLAT